MSGGKSDGTRAIDIWNGGDLHFTVLPDRALDIYSVRFCGKNIAFHTPSGVVAPQYYNDVDAKWLRSFNGGLMTTCGLQNIGDPDTENSEYSVHGRISNTPCENLSVMLNDSRDQVDIFGTMREAVLFGERLLLKRSIHAARGEDAIILSDEITNIGYSKTHLSVLYHFNIGYPLLSEKSIVKIPSFKIIPRNDHAATDVENWDVVRKPTPNYEEMCYYHFISEDDAGYRTVGIDNPEEGIGISISYRSPVLDRLVQWRMFGCGDYVMGLEPASCTLAGVSDAVNNGSMKYIDPGETIRNEIKVAFRKI